MISKKPDMFCLKCLHPILHSASAASSASWVVVKGSPKMLTLGSVASILWVLRKRGLDRKSQSCGLGASHEGQDLVLGMKKVNRMLFLGFFWDVHPNV